MLVLSTQQYTIDSADLLLHTMVVVLLAAMEPETMFIVCTAAP